MLLDCQSTSYDTPLMKNSLFLSNISLFQPLNSVVGFARIQQSNDVSVSFKVAAAEFWRIERPLATRRRPPVGALVPRFA